MTNTVDEELVDQELIEKLTERYNFLLAQALKYSSLEVGSEIKLNEVSQVFIDMMNELNALYWVLAELKGEND